MSETNSTAHKPHSRSSEVGSVVYREQVRLLYKHLRFAILAAIILAPVFVYIIWDYTRPAVALSWLALMFTAAMLRYLTANRFKRIAANDTDIRRWEIYFLIGVAVSALLWGSTSIWFQADSPASQLIFHTFIITGLISGSIATLSSRPLAFRLFLLIILLPYIAKLISLGSTTHIVIASLITIYILFMLPISNRICTVITESLQLRYKNLELIESYKEADQINKKANEALFSVMQNNKKQELELQRSETFLSSIFRTANDGVITTDAKGLILAINHAVERDFGYTENEMIGKSINIIMSDEIGKRHDHYIGQYLKSDTPVLVGRMLDVMGKRKDGSLFPMEITVSETRIEGEIFFTGFIRNTTERKAYENAMAEMMKELAQAKIELEAANAQLEMHNRDLTQLSEHDALTGIANRRFLMNAFQREWFRHQRNSKSIAVILLDIDFFKKYNDSYGHPAGDQCLMQIASVLSNNIARSADFVARYGGEEFIVVLPETDIGGAFHLAEKMRQSIEQMHIEHTGSTEFRHITISGGVAAIKPNKQNSCEQLIEMADKALYDAKHGGRNRICKYSEDA